MLSAYADTFASRRLILDARLQPEIFVLAGEDLIETVLENIFDNAIEVSPNGSKIIVELRAVQSRAELSVLDRGPGVPHGDRKSVVAGKSVSVSGALGVRRIIKNKKQAQVVTI